MLQSRTIRRCSSLGFCSSGERSSSFKAWPGFVLLRWFQNEQSKTFARSTKPKTIDAEIDTEAGSRQTDFDDLQKSRARLQDLIERAYAETVARPHNR